MCLFHVIVSLDQSKTFPHHLFYAATYDLFSGGTEMSSCESTELIIERETESTKAVIGKEETGLTHECGVFGCIATGDWPTQIDVAQVICLGLVALQHRYCYMSSTKEEF
jgi:Glutamine phosphoribosylpyrophosphate amidotransferase